MAFPHLPPPAGGLGGFQPLKEPEWLRPRGVGCLVRRARKREAVSFFERFGSRSERKAGQVESRRRTDGRAEGREEPWGLPGVPLVRVKGRENRGSHGHPPPGMEWADPPGGDHPAPKAAHLVLSQHPPLRSPRCYGYPSAENILPLSVSSQPAAPAVAEKTRQKNGGRVPPSPCARPPRCCCCHPALVSGEGGSPAPEIGKWWHLPERRRPDRNAFRVLKPGGLQFPLWGEPGWTWSLGTLDGGAREGPSGGLMDH